MYVYESVWLAVALCLSWFDSNHTHPGDWCCRIPFIYAQCISLREYEAPGERVSLDGYFLYTYI